MKRTALRFGAVTTAAALTLLSMAPAHAATVSHASATALRVSVAGNGGDSGVVRAVHDGRKETVTGSATPPIAVLRKQDLLDIGVLAQEATARVLDDGTGNSFACAGVAGNGGSVVQIGESSCITPGEPIGLSIANLDLTGAELVDPESALGPLNEVGHPLMSELVGPATKALSEGLAPLGELGIGGTFGALESRCVANRNSAEGDANIVESRLVATGGGESFTLLNLPVSAPPNTDLLVNLDTVATAVLQAVRTNLTEALGGRFSDGTQLTDALKAQLVDQVIAKIAPQLEPLSDNVLKVIINEQQRGPGRIEVTALSIDVLPAAEQFEGFPLAAIDIAEVSCGPNGRFVPGQPAQPAAPANPAPGAPAAPAVPTAVASGVAGDSDLAPWALAGLVLVAVTAGVAGYRRSLVR